MFDSLVAVSDHEAGRRNAVSFALTSSLVGAGIGGFLLGTVLWATNAPPAPVVEAPMVFLEEPPAAGGGDPLPALPAAPKAPPSKDVEPPDDVRDLTAAPPEDAPVASPSAAPVPTGGGGTGEGPGDGPGEGPGDGPGARSGTGDGDGVHYFDHEALGVRRQVIPDYPEAARALQLGKQRCLASVSIDAEGVPYAVEVTGCPVAFHRATEEGILKWRWYPPKVGKARVAARTTIAIVYRLD